jgi:hypothetical protein
VVAGMGQSTGTGSAGARYRGSSVQALATHAQASVTPTVI